MPDYSTVEDFDAADSPWSRATGMPKNEEEEEEMLSFVTRERWLNTCSKHVSQLSVGWHPNLACFNRFQEYELGDVFPHLYQQHGLARSGDVQAQRQASRAAHRVALSARASSTVPGPAIAFAGQKTVFEHPIDSYLGENANLLHETNDPMCPTVVNDDGVPQPPSLGSVQAREWFLNSKFGNEWGDLTKAWREQRELRGAVVTKSAPP